MIKTSREICTLVAEVLLYDLGKAVVTDMPPSTFWVILIIISNSVFTNSVNTNMTMCPYLINTVSTDRKVTTLNISLLIKKDVDEKSFKWSLKKLTQIRHRQEG